MDGNHKNYFLKIKCITHKIRTNVLIVVIMFLFFLFYFFKLGILNISVNVKEIINIIISFIYDALLFMSKTHHFMFFVTLSVYIFFKYYYCDFIKLSKKDEDIKNNYYYLLYFILLILVIIFYNYCNKNTFYLVFLIIEIILTYILICNVIETKKIAFISDYFIKATASEKQGIKDAKRTFLFIYLLILGLLFMISVDYTKMHLSSNSRRILYMIYSRKEFRIVRIFYRNAIEKLIKSGMYTTILEFASMFITFMGFIMGFLTESIYSINIHMLLNWECNQFKLFYYRLVTVGIVIISFFLSESKYTFSILYLDIYLIWIILYNLYLISSITVSSSLPRILCKRINKDIKEINYLKSMNKNSLQRDKSFKTVYVYWYGKTIFMPLTLLLNYVDVSKKDSYQVILNTFNNYCFITDLGKLDDNDKGSLIYCVYDLFETYLSKIEIKKNIEKIDKEFIVNFIKIIYDHSILFRINNSDNLLLDCLFNAIMIQVYERLGMEAIINIYEFFSYYKHENENNKRNVMFGRLFRNFILLCIIYNKSLKELIDFMKAINQQDREEILIRKVDFDNEQAQIIGCFFFLNLKIIENSDIKLYFDLIRKGI